MSIMNKSVIEISTDFQNKVYDGRKSSNNQEMEKFITSSTTPVCLRKLLSFIQIFGLKILAVCTISMLVSYFVIQSMLIAQSVKLSQETNTQPTVADILGVLQSYFIAFTYAADCSQMFFFKVKVDYSNNNDVAMFLSMSTIFFIGILMVYTVGLPPQGVYGLYFQATIVVVYTVAISFLFYVAFGVQNSLRAIKIVRPKYATTMSKLSKDSIDSDLKSTSIHSITTIDLAVEAMDREYFHIKEYSVFLRNRLIYSLPVFVFSVAVVLLHTTSVIYAELLIFQIPYFMVVFFCIQLNRELEIYEDKFECDTDLKVRILDYDIKHSWLISMVVSISTVLIRIGLLNQGP